MNNMPADKNWRVLVIDDNRAIHDDFRKILSPATATATAAALNATEAALFGPPTDTVQQTQFEVDSAYQGQEGVLLVEKALAAGLPYAMAFVDVRMPPGWDGAETTLKIWALDPKLQVVLCTANGGRHLRIAGWGNGNPLLPSPVNSKDSLISERLPSPAEDSGQTGLIPV